MADLKTLLGDAYQEDMTLDAINEALAAKEFVDKKVLEEYVPKSTADKYATEAADYKKKWKATQTEQEQKQEAEKEEREAMLNELKALRRSSSISDLEKRYLGLEYDAETAAKIAVADYDGDKDTVFELQRKFKENLKKAARDEVLKKTPGAASGNETEIDYAKQIKEAQDAGDILRVSALLRQQALSNKK